MTREEIGGALEAYAAAKNHHDVDAILALCHEDCFYESVPLGGRVEGKEALASFYGALFSGLQDYYGDFDGTAFGEDSAVVWGRFGGTLGERFMGVEVEEGRRIDIPVTFVCTFRDGLLTGDTGYFDAATFAEQVGVSLETVRQGAPASSSAADFVDRFQQFWQEPSADLVPGLVAPDVVAHWPGVGRISGAEYPEHIGRILELAPDLRLEVTDHAAEGELVFISWHARAKAGETTLEWRGIDRFRLRGDRAVEVLVAYDSAPLTQALGDAASASLSEATSSVVA